MYSKDSWTWLHAASCRVMSSTEKSIGSLHQSSYWSHPYVSNSQVLYPHISMVSPYQVVHAAQGKVPIFFDGGVRRGTDIFKALALGAKAVLVNLFEKITCYLFSF